MKNVFLIYFKYIRNILGPERKSWTLFEFLIKYLDDEQVQRTF